MSGHVPLPISNSGVPTLSNTAVMVWLTRTAAGPDGAAGAGCAEVVGADGAGADGAGAAAGAAGAGAGAGAGAAGAGAAGAGAGAAGAGVFSSELEHATATSAIRLAIITNSIFLLLPIVDKRVIRVSLSLLTFSGPN